MWLKEAGITDVGAFFLRGYRDIYRDVNLLHKLMTLFCDSLVKMVIVKMRFREDET